MLEASLSSAAAALLAQFPRPVSLQPSRRKWLLILAGSLGFVAIGIWALRRGTSDELWMMWAATAFFGLCAVVAAAMLLPRAGGLVLDHEGFVMTSLFRSHRTRWKDC